MLNKNLKPNVTISEVQKKCHRSNPCSQHGFMVNSMHVKNSNVALTTKLASINHHMLRNRSETSVFQGAEKK